jgi:hypothetical protein
VCSLGTGDKLVSVIQDLNALRKKFSHYFEVGVEDFDLVPVPFGVLATFF